MTFHLFHSILQCLSLSFFFHSFITSGIAASNSIVPKVELRSEHLEKKPIRPESDLRLPSAVAAFVLETVYRHIQPRYPFMDWIVLHNHWQDRDKYITAAIEGRLLERDESSIAFLILVTIAVGTQLCSRAEMRLPPSEEYYKLSLQYMDSIVQLHNLPNVQGEFSCRAGLSPYPCKFAEQAC